MTSSSLQLPPSILQGPHLLLLFLNQCFHSRAQTWRFAPGCITEHWTGTRLSRCLPSKRGPKPPSSPMDASQLKPHGTFCLHFGSRERGLVFSPSGGQKHGSDLTHVSWEIRSPCASHQSSLGSGPEDELPYHTTGVYTCVIIINMVHRSFEIKISDCGLIYCRRYQEVLSQDPLLIPNWVTGETSTCLFLLLWNTLWLITDR